MAIMPDTHTSSTEPDWLAPIFTNIPDALRAQPWGVWRAEPRPDRPGKFNKKPRCSVSGHPIGANKPNLFGNFESACAAYQRGGYTGVGVLLTGNGIIGVDIDDVTKTFADHPEAQRWFEQAQLAGAYCEHSPSGTGLRIFMAGKLPGSGRKSGPLEIYDDARFLTVTGHIVLHTVGVNNG